MFFRKLIGLAFITMLFVGAMSLFGAGRGRTQDAWTQGYIAGQQSVTANADGNTATAPPAPANRDANPNGYGYGHSHFGFFPGFGLLFCLIPFFFMGGLFILFGGRRHMGRRGPWCRPDHWQQHGQDKYKGPKSPWMDDDDLADEPIMKS